MSNHIIQDNHNTFAIPQEQPLASALRFTCPHCGYTFYVRKAILFYWPDRNQYPLKGLVVNCIRCGYRQYLSNFNPDLPDKPDKVRDSVRPHKTVKKVVLSMFAVICFLTLFSVGGIALKNIAAFSPSSAASETELSTSDHSNLSNTTEHLQTATIEETDNSLNDNQKKELPSSFDGLNPVEAYRISTTSIKGPEWSCTRPFQGIEWNTDTMDSVFYSYGNAIIRQSTSGVVEESRDSEGNRYAGIDYYDDKLFVARTKGPSAGECYILILNAYDLQDRLYTKLIDMEELRKTYMEAYGKVSIIIDGITVAPDCEKPDDLKVYVSFGVWDTSDNMEQWSLLEKQIILQYDYDQLMQQAKNLDSITAERTLYVDLGPVSFGGIQTLEYDRDTGNIWCAVRSSGYGDTLFELCLRADTDEFDIIRSYSLDSASDGFTSVGNHCYYDVHLEYDGTRVDHTSMTPTIHQRIIDSEIS